MYVQVLCSHATADAAAPCQAGAPARTCSVTSVTRTGSGDAESRLTNSNWWSQTCKLTFELNTRCETSHSGAVPAAAAASRCAADWHTCMLQPAVRGSARRLVGYASVNYHLRPHLATMCSAAIPSSPHAAAGTSSRIAEVAAAVVEEQAAGRRLDVSLPTIWPKLFLTVSSAKRAIRRSEVRVNGERARTDDILAVGDRVAVFTRIGAGPVWEDEQQRPGLDVAWQDDHMAIVIKPQVRLRPATSTSAQVLHTCCMHACNTTM